jgi:hypothetical protein
MDNLIKSTNGLNKNDLQMLREKFVQDYSRKKGWNSNALTPNQMLEIVEQSYYKNPGLIKG